MTLDGLYVPVLAALAVAVLILVVLYAGARRANGSYRIALNAAFSNIQELEDERVRAKG